MKHSRENQSPSKTASEDESSKAEGGFIGRWARRKHDAAIDVQEPLKEDLNDPLVQATNHALQPEESSVDLSIPLDEAEPAPILTDEDMPDIETLSADSDFSPFFSEGVSKQLRNLALKKLFFSGKFSARDGLDDYDDDFTKFEPLGDTVTSDMKFHARRKEKARLAALEEEKLKLETAQAEGGEELPEGNEELSEGNEELSEQHQAKALESESTTVTDPTKMASTKESKQDDHLNTDDTPLENINGVDNKIVDESVTETASHKDLKDKEPHV